MRTFKCTACNEYDRVGIEIDELFYVPTMVDDVLDLVLFDEARNRVNYRLRAFGHENRVKEKLEELRKEDPNYKGLFCFNCGEEGTVILL